MKEQEPTNRELMNTVNNVVTKVDTLSDTVSTLGNKVDTLSDTVNTLLETVSTFAESVDERFNKVDERFVKVEQDIGVIKATMVTKDYLDEKLGNLRGDMVSIDRKQEEKVNALVSKLADKKVLTRKEAADIAHISPFPIRPVI